jgi:hypothetical protein
MMDPSGRAIMRLRLAAPFANVARQARFFQTRDD